MSIYTKRKFSPCEFITEYSSEVWEKLKKVDLSAANAQMIRYDETSITQELIYLFQKLTKSSNFHLFENKIEQTSGADLELRIVSKSTKYGYHAFIQSKRVYGKSKSYDALNSKHGREQMERLIKYVKKESNGAIPLYLFYNYHSDSSYNESPQDYGLTVTPAAGILEKFGQSPKHKIEPWTSPLNFKELHIDHSNFCIPFYSLFCQKSLATSVYDLRFPFNIPLLFLKSPIIQSELREVKLIDLLDKGGDLEGIQKTILNKNFGVVDSTYFKQELNDYGIELKLDHNVESSRKTLSQFNNGEKSNWLKGYGRIEDHEPNEQPQNFNEPEIEEDENNLPNKEYTLKARYKIVLIIE